MADESNPSSPHHHHRIILTLIVIFLVSLGIAIGLAILRPSPSGRVKILGPLGFNISRSDKPAVTTFTSEAEFKTYLESGASQPPTAYGLGRTTMMESDQAISAPNMGAPAPAKADGGPPNRFSQTNVQVFGIDEPDILKTDGTNLYFSPQSYSYGRFTSPGQGGPVPLDMGIMEKRLMQTESAPAVVNSTPPTSDDSGASSSGITTEESKMIAPDYFPTPQSQSKVISAFPPSSLKELAKLDQQGDLLLSDSNLAIFSNDRITSYNVSNPISPQQQWQYQYGDNSNLVTARLYNQQLYVVTQTGINYGSPCPVRPLILKGSESLTIPCTEIYHPISIVPAELTYTVLILNPKTGEIQKHISFLGSYNSSAVYMSAQSLYLTYARQPNQFDLLLNFYSTTGNDLLPVEAHAKLSKLRDYDISDQSKLTELQLLTERYYASLNQDDNLKAHNEYNNRFQDYIKQHLRELESTQIVKIAVGDLTVTANGQIPGALLNQFSLDEYNDHLRLATTINNQWGSNNDSINDLYVLDNNLNVSGSIQDLGLSERIYSARFIEDKGYLVTYRQTDPFYVFDLSNPKQPKKSGELKIPGYSSYLHPLAKNLILGVGQESSQVKLSLFDVSNPSNPTEASKYLLQEGWSEVSQTHHAFLQDQKKGIFFIPGGQGGYIFTYQNNQLKLTRAVSGSSPRRAVFINDYLYIVSDNQIVILNESDWTEVNKLGI